MDEKIKKHFQGILKFIEIDIVYMKRNMAVFKKLRQLVKFEGEIISRLNWLLNWIVDTYTTDSGMSIRRLVDIHPDPHCMSLMKFLKELKNLNLNNVDAADLQHDIDHLDGDKNPQLKKILRFTCQDRAHSDDRMKMIETKNLPPYADVSFDNEVFPEVDNIERIFTKYYRIFYDVEPLFMKEEYIKHNEMMINDIDNTIKRIRDEKLKD